jgi:hypothetical protein
MSSNYYDAIIVGSSLLGSIYLFKHSTEFLVKSGDVLDDWKKSNLQIVDNILYRGLPILANCFFLGASTPIIFFAFQKAIYILNKP